ncbi:glycine betaine ABC transporter substrate-binding protein [Tissierella sp.]|uniref:glycine betaine ABC transporter substrate-binding protein n=1 Tax=Tissierella sp. TaxID=41274 RepID=UPI003F948790
MEWFIIKKSKILLLALAAMIFISGCAMLEPPLSKEDRNKETKGTVQIGYVQWASAEASTYIVKEVLEEMGYDVEIPLLQTGLMYQSTATGKIDGFVCSWLPDTDTNYWSKYKDDIIELNNNYESAQIGLVVPEYVDIDSIEELKDHKEEFEGRIVGIDPGAAQMVVTDDKLMPHYGLEDWTLEESGGPAMTAELSRAIENEEWIVVTGWKPHWKWAEWDLKFLEDPDKIMGDGEYIKSMGKPTIKEDLPEVAAFLENYVLSTEELSSVMLEIQEGKDPEDAAKDFIEENRELVDSWIPEDK